MKKLTVFKMEDIDFSKSIPTIFKQNITFPNLKAWMFGHTMIKNKDVHLLL